MENKVICKKYYTLNGITFYTGKSYYTYYCNNKYMNDTQTRYYKLVLIHGIYFFLDKQDIDECQKHSSCPYFYDYFLDIKEIRKQKLDKIYESCNIRY